MQPTLKSNVSTPTTPMVRIRAPSPSDRVGDSAPATPATPAAVDVVDEIFRDRGIEHHDMIPPPAAGPGALARAAAPAPAAKKPPAPAAAKKRSWFPARRRSELVPRSPRRQQPAPAPALAKACSGRSARARPGARPGRWRSTPPPSWRTRYQRSANPSARRRRTTSTCG